MRLFFLFWILTVCGALSQNLEIIRKIPHSGYSEGLDFYEGYLWHALPKSLVKIDPKDGTVIETFDPATHYSESLTWFLGKLWNLSFSDNGIYAGKREKDKIKFKRVGDSPEIHGWGITHDGKHLILTGNYSSKLYFLDPKAMRVVKTISATVKDLEDLAWDGLGIWTSSFTSHRGQIFRIDPQSGQVGEFFSLPTPEECPIIDGIAFDGSGLWITGKQCGSIYLAKRPTERAIAVKQTP